MRQGIVHSLLAGGIFVSTLLVSGCANNQKAVSLYTDAIILKDTGQTGQAVAKLNEAATINPNFSLAYSLLGDIYQESREYEKSAEAYEKAVATNSWSYQDYLNLGQVNQAMKKYNSAVKAYVRATQIMPDSAPAYAGAAESYYELKDYKNALKYASRARQLDSTEPDVLLILGNIYNSQKDYDQAIEAYKSALAIGPEQPKVMDSLATAYLRSGQFEPAKELLVRVVAIEPNSVSYQHLGYAYLKLKNFNDAVASYRKATELAPADAAAHKGLGVALMLAANQINDQKLKTEAIGQWQKSLELQSDQPKLRELLRKYQF